MPSARFEDRQPSALQWGGRFVDEPSEELLRFGSSLHDDLPLAPFDVECSRAHVIALRNGGVIGETCFDELTHALAIIAEEIEERTFELPADAEDIHGAIDRRVRALCPAGTGEWLHAGRSRNDQVATTLLLYAANRAEKGRLVCAEVARGILERAREELHANTHLAAVTHLQPAQPVLLAFWLCAAAEMMLRGAARFAAVQSTAMRVCPLGSAAVAGSTLPLDRAAASRALGFGAPARNALDAIGNRDGALDLISAFARTLTDASRIAADIVLWTSPAFGYVTLADAASTGSSLMPQKRNPDPFELVRAAAARAVACNSGAQATLHGLGLSYHRDLQETKSLIVEGSENALRALRAFRVALGHVRFNRDAMQERSTAGYTIATDIADALISAGISPREAHALTGSLVAAAEQNHRELCAADIAGLAERAGVKIEVPLGAMDSICAKKTAGSTHPSEVLRAIEELENVTASFA